MGVHARPSKLIVITAAKFKSTITITKDGCKADARSIMSIMMLAATCGSVLDLTTDGPDEEAACDAINALFVDNFSEGY